MNWLIRIENNLEVFSRIRQLVYYQSDGIGVNVTHPDGIASLISSTPDASYIINRQEEYARSPKAPSPSHIVLCL